jgi:hypothetical protein
MEAIKNTENPLHALNLSQTMGLVMARAGLGKTAILVQLALDCMLMGNKVLHVSIGETVDKAKSWYDDILSLVSDGEKVSQIPEIMRNRMIMTFKETGFSGIKLEERLRDLIEQDIFRPSCMIIDGYDFAGNSREALIELRDVLNRLGLRQVWFSAICHRDDDGKQSSLGIVASCHNVDDLFNTVLLINPVGDTIRLDVVKCDTQGIKPGAMLTLNPSTMLIEETA